MLPPTLTPWYRVYIDALTRALFLTDYVISGLAPSLTLPRTINVAAGSYVSNSTPRNVAAPLATTLAAPDGTQERRDTVYFDSAGALQNASGAPTNDNPVPPALPAGACLIAVCRVPSSGSGAAVEVYDGRAPRFFAMTTAGDLLVADAQGAAKRLAVGGAGSLLRVAAGSPAWLALGAAARALMVNAAGIDPEWGEVVVRGTLAARPAAGVAGRLFVTTDETGGLKLYRDSGAAWELLGFPATALHSQLTSVGSGDHHAQLHAAAHQPGGGDAMAVDAVAATGSLRTIGAAALQAAAGNHAHAVAAIPVIGASNRGAVISGGATVYAPAHGALNFDSTETPASVAMPRAGTLQRLYVVTNGTGTGGTTVVTIRKNAVDTTLTVTFAAGAAPGTVASDTTNTVAVAAGDKFTVKVVNNDPANNSTVVAVMMEFAS